MINIVWDTSMLDVYQTCPYKFKLRHILNKRLEGPSNTALDRGEVFHIGEEVYWNTLKSEPGQWDKAVSLGLSHMRAALSKTDLDTSAGEWYLKTFQINKEFWRQEDLSLNILDVEKSFAYELWRADDSSIRIIMIGKIDLIFSDNRYELAIMDHKSIEREFPIQRWQNQGPNYVTALGVDTIIFNRIGLQTSYSPEKRFKRIPIPYDKEMLLQWKNNTIKWSLRYLESHQANDWEMNQSSCYKFNTWCEFYEGQCDVSGAEAKEYKLLTLYKTTEQWDVSKILSKKVLTV